MNIDLVKIYKLASLQLNTKIVNPNETDIYACAHRLANVLVQEQENYSFNWTPSNTWIDQLANHPERKIRRRMKVWLQQGKVAYRGRAKYLFWLANNDKYKARDLVMHLLSIDQPKPDLEYLIINLTKIAYNVDEEINWSKFKNNPDTYTNSTTQAIDKLASSEEEYLRVLSLPEVDIPRMGGWRNTILGWHEEDLENIDLYTDSDLYLDLGGGHHTPWYCNRFGVPFVSLDLDPPWPINSVTLRYFDKKENSQQLKIMKDQMLAEYEKKLQEQAWQRWDLYKDPLPIDQANKITIISSGFLTSTFTPPEEHFNALLQTDRPLNVIQRFKLMTKFHCMMGLIKILEPVYQGKTVELITLSRPSKYMTKHRLCHIRWENQEMTYFYITEHKHQMIKRNYMKTRSEDQMINTNSNTESDDDL